MHPSVHAKAFPNKPAIIMARSGRIVTYGALEASSNRLAHMFRTLGVQAGDAIAIILDNRAELFELAWAAQRSGLIYTLVSNKLTADEAAFIVHDCDARLLIMTPATARIAEELRALTPQVRHLSIGGDIPGFDTIEALAAALPETPIADEANGVDMLYSSGTTGRPKGIFTQPPAGTLIQPSALSSRAKTLYDFDEDMVYLSPAPLYHAAPLRWSMTTHRFGGTVVAMERFDAEEALALIERHRVTHAQWVPTHFVRMLKLPPEVRSRYDHSSLECVFHSAAPCPVEIKQAMIEWWGPIVHEYYSNTEGIGSTSILAPEWLIRKGAVGRPFESDIRIVDDGGRELGPRKEGAVYMRSRTRFTYHKDPVRTAEAYRDDGFATVGDVGWLDEDGYLYLTDRKSYMIISGGVNIYPQDIEDALISHPKVADAAVIGAPCDEMGERVVAVVRPAAGTAAVDGLAEELTAYLRTRISHVKVPRQIDFVDELPRQDNGKLLKRLIRDAYWQGRAARVA